MRLAVLLAVVLTACGGAPSAREGASPAALDAVVVGTIHGQHMRRPDYPLALLGGLVERFAPDLILVEIRAEAFVQGRYEDGPLEMAYVTELGRARGVPVEPIDWWLEEHVGIEPAVDPALRPAYERELRVHGGEPTRMGFGAAQSTEIARKYLTLQNLEARYYAGNPIWNLRQQWFHHRAAAAIAKHRARRVMAFVGAAHRPELEIYLHHAVGARLRSAAGLGVVPVDYLNKGVPEAVVGAWRAGAARLTESAKAAPPRLMRAYVGKARMLTLAADRKGVCCIDPR